jgi:hypothetical protein
MPEAALADARMLATSSEAGETRRAAAALATRLSLRHAITTELEQTLLDTLGDAAVAATILPHSLMDPTAETLSQWLRERGAA